MKLAQNTRLTIEPPKKMPKGWNDENNALDFVFSTGGEWDDRFTPEETKFNSLCLDRQGRYFLTAEHESQVPDKELDWKLFHQVSLVEAMEWALIADNRGSSSDGTLAPLVESALKVIKNAGAAAKQPA